ncbi:hypothetical protein [Streptomyces sp. KL116D]|uniref:hypothetical protein n=1 Tax=Streptomyces sp. KL116D TaxID=3045152 RepID=UPI0035591470
MTFSHLAPLLTDVTGVPDAWVLLALLALFGAVRAARPSSSAAAPRTPGRWPRSLLGASP